MREIKCPLCRGRGKLEVRMGRVFGRKIGEVDCPLCDGLGRIIEVEPDDPVDVEVFHKDTKFEHAIMHRRNGIKPFYRDARMTVREALEKWGRRVSFCGSCFGRYVLFNGELVETD